MTKIAHLADLHFRKEKADDILIALDSFEYKAREEHVRLIAISGDIWDGATQNTEGSMFPVFVERIRRLAEIAPVVMIYGTPSHDTAGSLEVFETLESTFGITVLRPGIGYVLADGEICRADEAETGRELLIFGVPEPSKKWLLANAPAAGKETAAEAAAQALQNLFLGLGATRKQYSDLPCIVLYHGRVKGATFSNGQVSDDGVPRDVLTSVGADYYALGDIHEPQEIRDLPTARYSGSLYSCNWGETHKPGWNLIDIGEFSTGVMRREFPLPQQMKIPAESAIVKATQKIELDTELSDIDMVGRKVWLEIQCSRDHRIDTEKYLAELMDTGRFPDPVSHSTSRRPRPSVRRRSPRRPSYATRSRSGRRRQARRSAIGYSTRPTTSRKKRSAPEPYHPRRTSDLRSSSSAAQSESGKASTKKKSSSTWTTLTTV